MVREGKRDDFKCEAAYLKRNVRYAGDRFLVDTFH